MKNLAFILSIAIVSLLTSCAQKLTVQYSSSNENTGTIVVKPSNLIYYTSMTLNDSLLVEDLYVKKITVTNVPEGKHHLNLVCDTKSLKHKLNAEMNIDVIKGKEITKLIEVPPHSAIYWVYKSITYAALIYFYSILIR